MQILRVFGDSKNASKILPCRGDSLRILERSWDGVRGVVGEKRRSDDAAEKGRRHRRHPVQR